MTAHAKFSPSSAHRWIPCPGSIALCRDILSTSSEYADKGSALHVIAARALEYQKPAAFFIGEEVQIGERVFKVEPEDALHLQLYLDEVRSRVGNGQLLVEQKLELSETLGVADQFGTGDAVILSEDCKHLTVIDLKTGSGVKVFARDNEQEALYGLGALETFAPVLSEVEDVTLVIVQPPLDHIDEHTLTIEELRTFAEQARIAARHALGGLAALNQGEQVPYELFTPGDKQCRFCPAKATCPALQRMVAATVFDDFQALDNPAALAVQGEPPEPPADRLGATFGLLDLIEGWCRAVRGEVERRVLAGMTVIGPDDQPMKIIEGRKGHRAWTDEEAVEGVLTGLLPPEKAYIPRKIITPSQADKLLNRAKTAALWATLTPYIRQAPGAPKVVLGSDPAPPYTGGVAEATEFNVIPET